MLVANAFDLWQKDAFFSAAEEVQESADLMGSTYRAWVREMEQVETLEALSDLSRDLQTALGTAKWQLEEFVTAVRLSEGHHGENVTSARHGQFIAAIRDQIANVEAALCRSLSKGDQPLRWVNLDKEERDDLALFLSGTPKLKTSSNDEFLPKGTANKFFNHDGNRKEDGNSYFGEPRVLLNDVKSLRDGKIDQTADCVLEKEGRDNLDRTVGASRTWNSPSVADWRIIVAEEDGRDKLLPKVEVTSKIKGYTAPFWKARCGGVHSPPKLLNGLFNKVSESPIRTITFASLAIAPPKKLATQSFSATYAGGDGNDIFNCAICVLLHVKFSAAQDPHKKQTTHFSRCNIYHRNVFSTLVEKIHEG